MEYVSGRFEADGSDGRVHTVLIYVTPARGAAASQRMATADGLTVVPHGADRYYAILTGVRLTPRAGAAVARVTA